MTDDDKALVERLREMGEHPCRSELPMGADLREAADRIEQLEAEVKTALRREAETTARYDAKIDALQAEIARKDALMEKVAQAGLDAAAVCVESNRRGMFNYEDDHADAIRALSASGIVKEMCGG